MFRFFKRGDFVQLSSEEARTVVNALRRSAQTFSPDETFKGRNSRAARETRLAQYIGNRIK